MVDAYARGRGFRPVAMRVQAQKKDWLDALSTWYKYRHNQYGTGLNEMIASRFVKPLPPLPTPITTCLQRLRLRQLRLLEARARLALTIRVVRRFAGGN